MQNYEHAIFISYAWGGEREEIVNQMDSALQKRGIKIIRDKRDLDYKGSIKEFMERIGQGDCVIVVVSDKYLRSPNCMFELVEIAQNKQIHDRIFPVVLADADIYKPVKQIQYIKHWEDEIKELKETLGTVDPTHLEGIYEQLNLYDRIRDNISRLTAILSDMNALTPEMHQESDFSYLYGAIEKRMKDGSAVIISAPAEAVRGLVALRELMQRSSDVRTAVIAFQTDFKVVQEQVDRLGDYKDLHDLLHHLQFHCYNGIAQAATCFPNDEITLESFEYYALTLEEIVEDLKEVVTRPSMMKQELILIEEVEQAKTDLRAAIDTLDEILLKNVIRRLNRILAKWPARINNWLNHAARALRLPELLSALSLVCDSLTSLDLDTDKTTAFQSGVDALGELAQALSALVESHDQWQALDVELRRIEGFIDRDLIELEMWWPDIKSKAESLYIGRPEKWAGALKRESDILDEALSGNNPAKARNVFRRYQRLATERFYRVDIKLKALCGDLRQIGIPLAAVLEMIE